MAPISRVVAALGAGLVVAAAAACGGGTDGACAAPYLSVEPATARAGDVVTVRGEGLVDGCADTSSVDTVTGTIYSEESRPMRDVELRLHPEGGAAVTLVTVSADDDGELTVEVTIPATVPDGPAEIALRGTFESAEIRIVP